MPGLGVALPVLHLGLQGVRLLLEGLLAGVLGEQLWQGMVLVRHVEGQDMGLSLFVDPQALLGALGYTPAQQPCSSASQPSCDQYKRTLPHSHVLQWREHLGADCSA